MNQLLDEWTEQPISAVADFVRGVTYKKPQAKTEPGAGLIPLLRATNIHGNALHLDSELVFVPSELVKNEQHLRKGDVVIATSSGSSAVVGKSGRLFHDWEGTFGAFCAVLRAKNGISPEYLSYFLQSDAVRRGWSQAAQGTNINNLKRADIGETVIPVAPVDEQERIVEAIEEQLSRLDAGVESLQRAKRNLAGLRASILQAAVEGSLNGPRQASKSLPDGWVIASPDVLAASEPNALAIGPFGSNLKVSDYATTGVPLVFVRNIRRRRFDAEDRKFVTSAKAAELRSHEVQPGDLLITKMGDPPGDAAVYSGDVPAIITADCIKLRPRSDVDVRYLDIAFNSPMVRSQILAITRGVAQKKVSLGRFRNDVRIPLPPPGEQVEIVAEVEHRLSLMQALEKAVSVALARAQGLRRSVLRDAFSGRLVAAQYMADSPQRMNSA